MRSVLWPDRRVKPPYGAVEIDWGHPLAHRLDVALLMNEAAGIPADIARSAPITKVGSPSWAVGAEGVASRHVYGGHYWYVANRRIDSEGPQTWWADLSVGGSFYGLFKYGTSDSAVIDGNGGLGAQLSFTWGGAPRIKAVWAGPAVARQRLVVVYDGGTVAANQRAYGNGLELLHVAASESDGSGLFKGALATEPLSIGRSLTASIYSAFHWSRALSETEASWLSADPYCFLRPVVRRRYVVVATGGRIFEADLSLGSASGLLSSARAVFGAALGLNAAASMAPGSQAQMESTLSLALTAALSPQASRTTHGSLTLAASAGLQHTALATLVGQVTLAGAAGLAPGAQLVAQCALALSGGAGLSTSLRSTFEETLTLGARTALSADARAQLQGVLALTGGAGLTAAARLVAQAGLTLASAGQIGATLGSVLEEALALTAVAGLDAQAQQQLAAAIAFEARAAIAVTSRQIAEALLSLGSSAEQGQAAQAQLEASLTLSAIAALLQAAALASDQVPVFIKVIAEAFSRAHVMDETFRAAGVTGETFGVAHVTNERFN